MSMSSSELSHKRMWCIICLSASCAFHTCISKVYSILAESTQTTGTSAAVSCRPFRIGDSTLNRTTRPATLIVAWLANGYIE